MSKEILISIDSRSRRAAVTKDSRLEEFYVETNQIDSCLGNIYIGKVKSVVSSLNAAFVDIGYEKNGFLYLSEMESPLIAEEIGDSLENKNNSDEKDSKDKKLKPGQDIWVQVVKEPFGTKGPRLTTHISLAGRYLVLMPFSRQAGISRRIEDKKERERLKGILEKPRLRNKMGFIVRTVSEAQHKNTLLRDVNQLVRLWKKIRRYGTRRTAPFLVYKEQDLLTRVIRDYFTEDVDSLFIDSKAEFRRIRRYAGSLLGRQKLRKLHFYKSKVPLFESKKVEKEVEKIYGRKVFLKSGAYIVIEKTEGLIVIDVNSGRFKSKINSEHAAYSVNIEAAREIARQLRLRDFSGIIVIDFIDMQKERNRKSVLDTLKRSLSQDRAKTEVLGISKLGLVQMTRERTGKPVETTYYKVCPYCEGSGKIKNN